MPTDIRQVIAEKLAATMPSRWDDLEDIEQRAFLEEADGVIDVLRTADLEAVLMALVDELRPWYSGQFLVRRHGTKVPS